MKYLKTIFNFSLRHMGKNFSDGYRYDLTFFSDYRDAPTVGKDYNIIDDVIPFMN